MQSLKDLNLTADQEKALLNKIELNKTEGKCTNPIFVLAEMNDTYANETLEERLIRVLFSD